MEIIIGGLILLGVLGALGNAGTVENDPYQKR